MSDQIDFTILYDGVLVKSHSMEVKKLAPSLISLADFLEESFKNLYGNDKQLRVEFKANNEGSLAVGLVAISDFVKTFTTFFNSAEVSALLNFLSVIGIVSGGTAGVIKTVKWLRGRRIQRVISRDQGPDVEIETEDGDIIKVKREVPKLLKSVTLREKFYEFLEPLKKEGIDIIQFLSKNDTVEEEIDKDQLDYFEVPEVSDEELTNDTRTAAFTISSLSFKEDNKWRLSDGSSTYLVTISDEEFLDDVRNNRTSFAKDDVLVVRLETRQYKTVNGLKTDYNILEIIDHQSSRPQLDIPFE